MLGFIGMLWQGYLYVTNKSRWLSKNAKWPADHKERHHNFGIGDQQKYSDVAFFSQQTHAGR